MDADCGQRARTWGTLRRCLGHQPFAENAKGRATRPFAVPALGANQADRAKSISFRSQKFVPPMLKRRIAIALVLAASAWAAHGQETSTPPTQRKTSKPYTGDLSIFDSPGREERLQVNRVMDILGITAGKNVADIGAGSGWFTVRAAKRVTETGIVYAVDINPEAIRYIENRAEKEQLHNVKPILSKTDDSLLPGNAIDAVLMLKTYHEVEKPVVLLRNLRTSLRPGAKVGIIDRNGNGENHGVGKDVVIQEAAEAGYGLIGQYDFVKGDGMDYFLVFAAKP
jgi:SAM-dependent methyltransferase